MPAYRERRRIAAACLAALLLTGMTAAFALLAIAFGLLCLVSGGMFAGYGCIL